MSESSDNLPIPPNEESALSSDIAPVEEPESLENDPLKGKKKIEEELAAGYDKLIMYEVLTTPNPWIAAANTRLAALSGHVYDLKRQVMLSEADYKAIDIKITALSRQFDDYLYNIRSEKTEESKVSDKEKEEREVYVKELTELAQEVIARVEGTYKSDSREIQKLKTLLTTFEDNIKSEMKGNPDVTWPKAMGTQLSGGLYGTLQFAETQLFEVDFIRLRKRAEVLIERTQALQLPDKKDSLESEKEPIVTEYKKIIKDIIVAAKRFQKHLEKAEPRFTT